MRAIPLLLILAAAVTLAPVAADAAAPTHVVPRSDGDSDPLRIWLYVVGPLEPDHGAAAQAIADRLLRTAGVAIEWRMCGPADVCSRATDPHPHVTMILTSAARPSCGTAALERSGIAATVLISLPCIAQVVLDVTRSPAARVNPLLVTLQASHLTGAAMAHEVGHALGLRHTRRGIMQARLDTDDILALRRGQLAFQPTEVAAMRASTMWQGLLAARTDGGPSQR
jgi:hypothetical protein